MERELTAAVQYGDMRGTIGLDGFDILDPRTMGLRADTGGRKVIGISLYISSDRRQGKRGDFHVTGSLIVVDEELSGLSPSEIGKQAQASGKLRVEEVPAEVDVDTLLEHVKRLSIVLVNKPLDGANLVVDE